MKITQQQMKKLYDQDKIFIWSGRTLYGIGYSQAQNQFYLTKNLVAATTHSKRGEIKAMTREEAQGELQ